MFEDLDLKIDSLTVDHTQDGPHLLDLIAWSKVHTIQRSKVHTIQQ